MTSLMRPASKFLFASLISISFMLPAAARAAVVISEVMYNPKGTDSGHEWVELYNDGADPVVLVGGSGKGSWRIADSSNHTLAVPSGGVGHGSLTIAAGGYLIVSTDPAAFDAEFGNPPYSVIKSSLSLNNTGTTVSLIDGAGATTSSFTYASSMGGDDNGNSLQRTAGGWLQALPTPGAANATEEYLPPEEESSHSGSSGGTTPASSYVPPPAPTVFADAGADRAVIVGADTLLRARAYNRDQKNLSGAKFSWNFGDGTTAQGAKVLHHFPYPGEYAVELHVAGDDFSVSSRVRITAKEVSVGLAPLPGGGVAIENNADQDLDLSFWRVVQEEAEFTLPEYSSVLKGGIMRISAEALGFEATAQTELRYPNGKPVVSSAAVKEVEPVLLPNAAPEPVPEPAVEPEPQPEPEFQAVPAYMPPAPVLQETPIVPAPEPVVVPESAPEPQESNVEPLAAAAAHSGVALPPWFYTLALLALISFGLAGVYHAKYIRQERALAAETYPSAQEFTIE
ncbi:MAG: hypothetical protein JWL87_254 [Candidatus Adlerbacteria bacterium]|nr:hypothetical protein [Candidatus Adlerbacteria bacterium]